MIIDLQRFLSEEKPVWEELEGFLQRIERDVACRLSVTEVRRLHYLAERAAADLAKVATFSSEPEIRGHLEALVARAYGEIHSEARREVRLRPLTWFLVTFPRAFRRRFGAFALACAVTAAGSLFGGAAVTLDPDAKTAILDMAHLRIDPRDRVAHEEAANRDRLAGGRKGMFAGQLFANNLRVSILAMALGMSWGFGTLAMLFYNGVILGAVALDYLVAGEGVFMVGWLLPHGSVEIPAILVAGQAGFLLAGALLGRGRHVPLAERLREATGDLVTLIFGVALLLVWAALVEAFFSQYHEPVLPYSVKIAFGAVQLAALVLLLAFGGRRSAPDAAENPRNGAIAGAMS